MTSTTETIDGAGQHEDFGTEGFAGGELIPLPRDSLTALIACGEIVRALIHRAWEDRESTNASLLHMAASLGLIVEREPTDEEVEAGDFDADDVVLALAPAFAETMAGFDVGRDDLLAELEAAAEAAGNDDESDAGADVAPSPAQA